MQNIADKLPTTVFVDKLPTKYFVDNSSYKLSKNYFRR